MVKLISGLAPAKVNLFLRITARRADGYHELDSVFVPVSLYDRVALEVRTAASSGVTLSGNLGGLPEGTSNLAVRAATLFLEAFGINAHVNVDLHKEIPSGAGLGGGSSDAGAVLRMMAALFRIGDSGRLHQLAAALGADVPFFLSPRPARVTGIGEKLCALDIPELPLVLAVPPFEVSTTTIFGVLRGDAWSGPAPQSDIDALASGRISGVRLVNDLSAAAIALHPEINQLKQMLEELGAVAAAMSGSGGAVFGVFTSFEEATRKAREARRRAPYARMFAVCSLGARQSSQAFFSRAERRPDWQ